MSEMQFHPVADMFPMMTADEQIALRQDISVNGQREPILLAIDAADGVLKIADGRNRAKACSGLGIEPRYREWDGTGDLLATVVSLNLKRRHLSESQRAMIAQRLANMVVGQNRDRSSEDPQICGTAISQSAAADMLNVSERLISSARRVVREGDPELAAMVESGEIQVSEAEEIVRVIPKAQQKRIIKKGRNARREILNALKNKSIKHASKGKPGCLICSPDAEFTNSSVSAAMQLLADRAPSFARYFNDVIEEIESEGITDEARSNYEKVFAAIAAGMCEHSDCRRTAGLDHRTFEFTIATMLDFGMIEAYDQGGKTEAARGARKKLYRKTEQQPKDAGESHVDDSDDEDVDDDRYFL